MTEQEITELDRQVREEAQKKYLTAKDLEKIIPEKKQTFTEIFYEMFETGSACIEANGNCNKCKVKDKCKLPKTPLSTQ